MMLIDPNAGAQNYTPQMFGAVGDGVTDDRAALQRAIDFCSANGKELIIPSGTYIVSLDAWTSGGLYGLQLKSNLTIRGQSKTTSIIKLKDNSLGGGTFWRLLMSDDTATINNVFLENFCLDGNKANQVASTNGANILIGTVNHLTIDNVKSINARGQCIQVSNAVGATGSDIAITNCYVDGADFIGIQVAQCTNLSIENNYVANSVDNGIDVYGENGTVNPSLTEYLISGNRLLNNTWGIFLETTKNGVVSSNVVWNNTSGGIAVNRINGASQGINIIGNLLDGCPKGVQVSGDCNQNGISIVANTIKGFTTAALYFGLAGNASYINFANNIFSPATTVTPIVSLQGNQIAFVSGRANTVALDNYDVTKLVANTAATSITVIIEQWYGLSTNVGPSFNSITGFTRQLIATVGTVTLSPPTNTGGSYNITARVAGWGTASAIIPYRNEAGNTLVGTPVVCDPSTTIVSVVQNPGNHAQILITLHGAGAGQVNVLDGIFIPLPT